LITSGHLLDYTTSFPLELIENIRDILLTLSKNMLELWLLGAFGECQVIGQPMATRRLVAPLIDQDFRDGSLQLAGGHHASATLNHQNWTRT
jgi:hypothetical protein